MIDKKEYKIINLNGCLLFFADSLDDLNDLKINDFKNENEKLKQRISDIISDLHEK